MRFASVGRKRRRPPPKLKDEMRQPWQRGDWDFQRRWLIAGPFQCTLEAECLGSAGSEAAARPTDGQEQKRADGTSVKWHPLKSWTDVFGFDDLQGSRDGAVAYAFTKVTRVPNPGKRCCRWAATMAFASGSTASRSWQETARDRSRPTKTRSRWIWWRATTRCW